MDLVVLIPVLQNVSLPLALSVVPEVMYLFPVRCRRVQAIAMGYWLR